jgi:hypothetical protein
VAVRHSIASRASKASGSTVSLFSRRLVSVGMRDGRVRTTWTYLYAGDGGVRKSVLRRIAAAHARGDETSLARRHLATSVFGEASDAAVARLLPLRHGLARGDVSERQLGQVTGLWAVGVDAAPWRMIHRRIAWCY